MQVCRLCGKRPFKSKHFTDPIWRQMQCSSIKDGISYFSNWIDICSQFLPPCSLKATKSFQSLAFVLVSYSFQKFWALFSFIGTFALEFTKPFNRRGINHELNSMSNDRLRDWIHTISEKMAIKGWIETIFDLWFYSFDSLVANSANADWFIQLKCLFFTFL